MVVTATRTEARCTGFQCFAQQGSHLFNVLWRGHFLGQSALFHDVHAQRVVWHLHQKVEAVRRGGQSIHVLWKTLPVPHNAFMQSGARNVFHTFHEFDQIVFSARTLGRKADAAVAQDHGGHAVVDAGGEAFIPSHLTVVVGVQIDKARCDP